RQDFIPHQRDVAQASTRRAEEAAVPPVSGPPGGTYASPSPHSAPATSLTAPPAQPDPAEISRIVERFLSAQGRMPGASQASAVSGSPSGTAGAAAREPSAHSAPRPAGATPQAAAP